jgi:hypothetical protein
LLFFLICFTDEEEHDNPLYGTDDLAQPYAVTNTTTTHNTTHPPTHPKPVHYSIPLDDDYEGETADFGFAAVGTQNQNNNNVKKPLALPKPTPASKSPAAVHGEEKEDIVEMGYAAVGFQKSSKGGVEVGGGGGGGGGGGDGGDGIYSGVDGDYHAPSETGRPVGLSIFGLFLSFFVFSLFFLCVFFLSWWFVLVRLVCLVDN